MAELPFVDTHVHFWDLGSDRLCYSWLEPGWRHPVLGDIEALKVPRWDAEHLLLETRHANVVKVVHVESALGTGDPVEETRWLDAEAERTGWPTAIVARTNLKSPDVEAELARHAEASALLRGIRDFSDGDYLVHPDFARGCAALEQFDLVLGFEARWEDMHKARDLAARTPATIFLLDHAGYPTERSPEYFENWRRGMRALAEADNAWCKISGLGMCDNDWTVASIRPWVLECLEIFGVERCVMGTNWPVDKLCSHYDAVIDAYAAIIAELSREEQVALFSANAERIFRI